MKKMTREEAIEYLIDKDILCIQNPPRDFTEDEEKQIKEAMEEKHEN